MSLKFVAGKLNYFLKYLGIKINRIKSKSLNDPFLIFYEEKMRPKKPIYLNIGAHTFNHILWHNLDVYEWPGTTVDIFHDLSKNMPLPIEDNSVKIIYCSHVIEHLPENCVDYFFKESLRILRPNGTFRISCPDFDWYMEGFKRKDPKYFENFRTYPNAPIEDLFIDSFATGLARFQPKIEGIDKIEPEFINKKFELLGFTRAADYFCKLIPQEIQPKYPMFHCNWFNAEKLISLLSSIGFSSPKESKILRSREIVLQSQGFFDNTSPRESILVEAFKRDINN